MGYRKPHATRVFVKNQQIRESAGRDVPAWKCLVRQDLPGKEGTKSEVP
jgi:hypothetical protein